MSLELVYVGGPFSGKTRADVEENIRRAVLLGVEVAKLGVLPVIPHANTSAPAFEEVQGYEFWIAATMELLRRCDAIILTPDWERSSGARGEKADAESRGQPVFHTLEELKAWVDLRRSLKESLAGGTISAPLYEPEAEEA